MTLITDTNRRDVAHFMQEVLQDIVLLQSSRGLKASGRSAESLKVEQSGDSSRLVDGAGYFEYQERGRGPGKISRLVIEKIYHWLQFRKYGLDWNNEKERKRMAFLIARKIARRGTYIHITGDPTGVLTDPINQRRIEQLLEVIGKGVQANVESEVVRGITGN